MVLYTAMLIYVLSIYNTALNLHKQEERGNPSPPVQCNRQCDRPQLSLFSLVFLKPAANSKPHATFCTPPTSHRQRGEWKRSKQEGESPNRGREGVKACQRTPPTWGSSSLFWPWYWKPWPLSCMLSLWFMTPVMLMVGVIMQKRIILIQMVQWPSIQVSIC